MGPQFTQYEIVASVIGQKGLGCTSFTMRAVCPGDPDAHIKFKLDTISPSAVSDWLILSPSGGTTPLEIQVGVNPNAVANSFPSSGNLFVNFTTVDHIPPLAPRVTISTYIIGSLPNLARLSVGSDR